MPHKSLMHHDSQKNIFCHNFYLFFPICNRKEFKLLQLSENFKKKCANAAKDRPWLSRPFLNLDAIWPLNSLLNPKKQINWLNKSNFCLVTLSSGLLFVIVSLLQHKFLERNKRGWVNSTLIFILMVQKLQYLKLVKLK